MHSLAVPLSYTNPRKLNELKTPHSFMSEKRGRENVKHRMGMYAFLCFYSSPSFRSFFLSLLISSRKSSLTCIYSQKKSKHEFFFVLSIRLELGCATGLVFFPLAKYTLMRCMSPLLLQIHLSQLKSSYPSLLNLQEPSSLIQDLSMIYKTYLIQ